MFSKPSQSPFKKFYLSPSGAHFEYHSTTLTAKLLLMFNFTGGEIRDHQDDILGPSHSLSRTRTDSHFDWGNLQHFLYGEP